MSTEAGSEPMEEAFAGMGRRFSVSGDSPFVLESGSAWYVVSGAVHVFWSRSEGSTPVGRRHHLFRAEAGQLLLGVESGARPLVLVAVGITGTQLVELDQRELDAMIGERSREHEMAGLLDGWVRNLCGSVTDELPPQGCMEITEEAESKASTEARQIRPQSATLWLQGEPQKLRMFGRADLEVDGPVPTPFSRQVWLEVPAGSTWRARGTVAVLSEGTVWEGLGQLQELCLATITRAAEATRERLRQRLLNKMATDQQAFTAALDRIARTLDIKGAPAGAVLAPTGDDLLLRACRRIGVTAGFHVEAPPPLLRGREGQVDPVDAISRASRFRIRQVLLRDDWWRNEAGPLLAYVEEDGLPVALLPSSGKYLLYDPAEDREQPLTEKLAETLQPQAYAFYAPFPEDVVGLGGLLRFALKDSRSEILTFVLMGAVVGLLGLVTPIATRAIFNDIIPGAARTELLQVTLILLAIACGNAMFEVTRALALVRLEGKSGHALLAAIWDRLISLPTRFFRAYTTGNLASRAMGIETIRQILSGQVISNLMTGAFSLFHLGYLFLLSAKLAWWALLLILVAFGATVLLGRLQMQVERKVSAVRNRLSGTVLQLLTSISKLRVAGAEVQAFAQWAGTFSLQRQFQYRSRTRGNILTTFNAGFPLLANLVIFAFAAPLVTEEQSLRTGDFLAFTASFTIALRGILAASQAVNQTVSVLPLLEEAKPILETLPEVDSGKRAPPALSGAIDVNQVSFRYVEDGPLVLQNVTLGIVPGEFVALVGPSGSGKSSLLRLLLAFEEPISGSIYYDGQDLAGLDKQAVRSQLGVVLQGGRLMSGDIFTNIVGSSRATLDDAWEAARMAGLDRDIRGMPMQMHTVITQGGGTLSGGQRQRLMIARALVRKPRILFFDEATSALDNRTQAIVTESLGNLQATRVVVAHRLSTIQNADRICVLERGRLVESGTYEELMATRGTFFEVAKRQMA